MAELATNLRVWGATYRCWSCEHEWTGWTGPTDGCPACRHLFQTWTNYEAMRAEGFKARGEAPRMFIN